MKKCVREVVPLRGHPFNTSSNSQFLGCFMFGPKIFGLLYFWARDVLARDVLAKDFWANDIWAKYVWTKFTIKVTFGPNMFAPIFPEIQRKSIWPKRLWSKPPFHTKFGPNVFGSNTFFDQNVSDQIVFVHHISDSKV